MSPNPLIPIFRWDTLHEVELAHLNTRQPISGSRWTVDLTTGETIHGWRANDRTSYFCHGLTFGGIDAPERPFSPYSGLPVETILAGFFRVLDPESLASPGDIVVWRSPDLLVRTPHSAILLHPIFAPGTNDFDYGTILRTKNGMRPLEEMSFGHLVTIYGETYNVYTRK